MGRSRGGRGRDRRAAAAGALALPALIAFGAAAFAGTAPPPQKKPAPPDATRARLEREFHATVKPFLRDYCTPCHGKNSPEAQLDLASPDGLAAVTRDLPHWYLVRDRVAEKTMPPPGFGKQPSDARRAAVGAWISAVRRYEAARTAGDPGPVPARRLSNAEYDYTVRDLTGVDLRPAREFPVDPANQEGFDNTGESLTISPALMRKYAEAARTVADHLVLTTNGLTFAPHPVQAITDRDKFCVLRIVDFYKKQPTDLADYFLAAWRYRHRAALGAPNATLASVAKEAKVSPRYLATVWETLHAPNPVGPLARLRARWDALPAPGKGTADTPPPVVEACRKLRDDTRALRKKVAWRFNNLPVPNGFSTGGQVFVLWKDRQYAAHRRKLRPDALLPGDDPKSVADPDRFVPRAEGPERAAHLAAWERFCDVFPDEFYVAERGRMFVNDPGDAGRLLSAGLHNSMGYFRDDAPLMDLILDDAGRQTLDRMWRDFDAVASVPERMHLEFFVYERAESGTITDPEFDFARAEDRAALSDAKIKLLADLYFAKAKRRGARPETLRAIEEHFPRVSASIRAAEKARIAAEPAHLAALLDFAGRAYRRPLTPAERTSLLAFYRTLREKNGLTHEDAVRDVLTYVLVSPHFLYRVEGEGDTAASPQKAARTAAAAAAVSAEPLGDYALASRLSYFLWSSLPDAELLRLAAQGKLKDPVVLKAQARRMLKDPKAVALAREFGGSWLEFRRFDAHNAVDRARFPAFTNELRDAMYQEPVRFLDDAFRNDRPITEMLYGKHTFVNAVLARHYGMDSAVRPEGDRWVRVADADRYGRGGLLPMAAFLTANSPGLRTSPVKRGYWVVRRVLGEHIPPPPAAVPELPADEAAPGAESVRDALARHRRDPACASCHARFDAYGLAFENYGPIGERREKDLGGRPVDARAPFPGGGGERVGLEGLRAFVREKRERDFLETFHRKLLSYALGRSLQPSDDATLEAMARRSEATGHRFGALVESVVASPQFRHRRSRASSGKE